jgi:hypothetical protein
MRPEHDPSWSQYKDTIIDISEDPSLVFAVAHGPTQHQRMRLSQLGVPAAWAIVTPCNPRGRPVTETQNAARLERAQADLESRGVRHWQGHGRSADGLHVERGFAIAVRRETARQLAIEWEQSAFFWIDGEDVWLCPALVHATDERITAPSELVRICPLASLRANNLRIPEWEWIDDLFKTVPRLSDSAGTKLNFMNRTQTLSDLVDRMKRWKALPPLDAHIELSVPWGETIPNRYADTQLWRPTVPHPDADYRDRARAAIVAVLAVACSNPPFVSWDRTPDPARLVNPGTLFMRLHSHHDTTKDLT